jgi:hypothetical protein
MSAMSRLEIAEILQIIFFLIVTIVILILQTRPNIFPILADL